MGRGEGQGGGVGQLDDVRVVRGGAWNNDPRDCRSAYRNRNHPTNRNTNVGFRLAASHIEVTAGLSLPGLPGDGAGRFRAEAFDGGAGSVPRRAMPGRKHSNRPAPWADGPGAGPCRAAGDA